MQLNNRTILITGASSGIGRELALLLASKGCSLVLTGRDEERLTELARSTAATAIVADLSSPDSVRALCHQVMADHPEVSIVINNAAIQINGLFSETKADQLFKDIANETQVDLVAPIQICGLLLPLLSQEALRNKVPSAVVNLSTGLAMAPKKTAAVYCASKSGLRAFTKAFRFQLEATRRQGGAAVRAVDVILPLVDTRMTRGRGKGKISAAQAAASIVKGLEAQKNEIYVGKAKLLRILNRLIPEIAEQMFRNA